MKFNILKIYFMDNVHNIYPLFKTQITPKFYLIIYYIFIYFGVYSIYTLFIQSIGSEIGFNLIDSQFSYYSTSAGITVPRVIDSLNSKNSKSLRSLSTNISDPGQSYNSYFQIEKDVLLPKYLQNSSKIKNVDRNLLDKYSKSGYTNYQVLFKISSVSYSNIFNYLDNIQEFINGLEDNKIYTILVQAISIDSQSYASILPRSLFIHRKSSANQFLQILSTRLISYEYKYYSDESYDLVITGREWYTIDQLNKEKYKEVEQRSDKIMEEYLDNDKSFNSLFKLINNYYDLIHIKLTPQIIENLPIITGNDSYTLYDLESFFSNSLNSNRKLLEFSHFKASGQDNIFFMLDNNNIVHKWVDSIQGENGVLRQFNDLSILFKMDNTYEVNARYRFDSLVSSAMSPVYNHNIGCIDFETYACDSTGRQEVYAGGWIVNGEIHKFILGSDDLNNSHQLVERLFNSIFESKYSNYTFYVHNLSKFDSIFIIDSLSRYNYDIKSVIKDDNAIVSLNISSKVSKLKIKILDSALMIKGSLRDIGESFQCLKQKGHFPYKFVKSDSLNYIGLVPAKENYNNINLSDYNNLCLEFKNKNWSVKTETLKYLELDLLSLLEILFKFSKIVYDEYGLNITDFKTISGLSLHIYLSNFYDTKNNIKLIKGSLEKEIRKAYYGGLVHLNCKGIKINRSYLYDMNSQYPAAMLNDMPVGDPILSNDIHLDSYFGFCYANIIPPTNLDILIIPHRNDNGEVTFPSKPFSGLYFSELLKSAIKYGYKVEVIGGIKFERGVGVFNEFVETIYSKRLEAKLNGNNVLQMVNKLTLNSLYGRMGMKNIENKTVIVNKDKAEILLKNKNIVFFTELNDKVIVKYNNNIDSEIVKLMNNFNSNNPQIKSLAGITKIRGVSSSVPIAAAITAYAQISMMKFKNISGNKCLYSDTDSILLEFPLLDKYIDSNKLGFMKLEHILTEGYFISKKLYAFKNIKGEIVIKSKGIGKGILDFDKFILLFKGEDIIVQTTVFMKNIRKGTVNIINRPYTIKGSQYINLNQTNLIIYNNFKLSLIPYKKPDLNLIVYIPPKENSQAIISLPWARAESANKLEFNDFLSLIEKIRIKLLLDITSKDKAILQRNRILTDINRILNQLQKLKPVKDSFERFLELNTPGGKKYVIVKSKLFFKYGQEGIIISHMLLKYLNKLDLFDIIDLIQGNSDSKLLKKILKYTKPLPQGTKRIELVTESNNKPVKFNIKNNNLNILISISFLKIIKDGRSKDLFKLIHKVTFDISLLDIQDKIKIIKHTHTIHTPLRCAERGKEHFICKEKLDCIQLAIAEYLI